MKEQITGKTTWGTGIWESKRKLNKWVLHRWVTGLFRGSSRVMYVWVKPWAEAEQFGAAHHLGLGLGQVLGMLQTVKGQSYIHQATANAGGHKWNAWCSLAACLRGLMPFPPSMCHTLPHTVGGHIRPTAKVDRYIIQSISKFALYLHVFGSITCMFYF